MSRLTITLTDARHAALKQAAAQRNKTIGELVEESLEFYGIRTSSEALALVQRARERAALSESAAMALVVKETRLARQARRR
jgi:hypothetical protein